MRLVRRTRARRVFAVSRQEVPRSGFVGMGGLACLLFLLLGTATLAPWWVTGSLVVLWLVLLGLSVRWFVPHPGRLPWLAVAGVVVWAAVLPLGAWLGAW